MSSRDRRHDERIPFDLGGAVKPRRFDDEVVCRVANLSRSGAMAVSQQPLPEMTQVKIRIQVELEGRSDKESFSCEAAVVRCDRRPDGAYDIGLFFTAMAKDDRAILTEMLKSKPVPSH